MYHSGDSPFWRLAPPPSPCSAVGLWVLGISGNLSLWQQRRENHNNRASPEEMHPFCRLWRRLPGGGDLLNATLFSFISCTKSRAAKTSPFGGSTAAGGDRGAFPRALGAVCLFSIARQGGFMVLPAHQLTSTLAHYRGFIKTGAAGAHHHPRAPKARQT